MLVVLGKINAIVKRAYIVHRCNCRNYYFSCMQVAREYDDEILTGQDASNHRNTLAHLAVYRADPELFKVTNSIGMT